MPCTEGGRAWYCGKASGAVLRSAGLEREYGGGVKRGAGCAMRLASATLDLPRGGAVAREGSRRGSPSQAWSTPDQFSAERSASGEGRDAPASGWTLAQTHFVALEDSCWT